MNPPKTQNGGRWQLAFWILTGFVAVIILPGVMFVGKMVLANDEKNVKERQKIIEYSNKEHTSIRREISLELEKVRRDQIVMYDKLLDKLEEIRKEIRRNN